MGVELTLPDKKHMATGKVDHPKSGMLNPRTMNPKSDPLPTKLRGPKPIQP